VKVIKKSLSNNTFFIGITDRILSEYGIVKNLSLNRYPDNPTLQTQALTIKVRMKIVRCDYCTKANNHEWLATVLAL